MQYYYYSKVFGTLVTLVGCLGVLLSLHTFHSRCDVNVKQPQPSEQQRGSSTTTPNLFLGPERHGRNLVLDDSKGERRISSSSSSIVVTNEAATTDDSTSQNDAACRTYLMEFLNGTTDAEDLCQGMHNAYTAGDCQDTSGLNNLLLGGGENEENKEDGSTTGTLIDDVFEAWECCDHIGSYYSKHCLEEQQHELDALHLFGIISVLIACWLFKSWLRVRKWHHWIPDAGACILVGAMVGLGLRVIWSMSAVQQRMMVAFNNNFFLQILLPPIIFEAALSIDKRAFRRDLFPILTFAILGTGFSAVAIGCITYYVSAWGSSSEEALPFLDSLVFGALMSSIDPVATLSILSSVGVGQGDTLYTLVFGESLLNDGVSIVLFDSLVRHLGDAAVVGRASAGEILMHFVGVTVGSVAIGLFCGALCTFYFWAMKGYNTAVSEGALFFTWSLIPYYIADALDLSGIISIMVMGFMLDYYVIGGFQDTTRTEWNTMNHIMVDDDDDDSSNSNVHGHHQYRHNLSNPFNPPETVREKCHRWCTLAFSGKGHMLDHSRNHVGYVAEVISSIVETAIFAYLGLFLFNDTAGDIRLSAAGIFACVSSRAVMVVVLCAMINICVCLDMETRLTNLWRILRGRGDTLLDTRQTYETTVMMSNSNSSNNSSTAADPHYGFLGARTQFILFTAGIRGAVSYALVQMIPVYDAVSHHGSHYKGELRAMTSATIVGVLFVFGALTYVGVDKKNNNSGSGMGTRSSAAAATTTISPMEAEQTLSQQLLFRFSERGVAAADETSGQTDNYNPRGETTEFYELDTRLQQQQQQYQPPQQRLA